ncbi:MAG TPA: HlyD family efflux transporter periplasmic adaptor subunit [Chthoniobacteraceae bacterium]|nr:HlyD family efflux transporter periplasmic adaptor subunit [Chthoniobacteraceae bacterium]
MTTRLLLLAALALAACGKSSDDRVQGYVEGDFVYVASPLAGTLLTRPVERGTQVKEGDPLFTLDPQPEQAAREEAERRLSQGRAQLADTTKGRRAPEIEALQQQLQQARTAAVLSEKNLKRQEELYHSGASAANEYDAAKAARDGDAHRVSQLAADLQAAELGSRDDMIAAAAANVKALEAMLARADWNLAQKRQATPQAGLVFDTMYEPGEWVAPGRPVISLLPPEKVKVRAFVPEGRVGAVHPGDQVRVSVDGASGPVEGRVAFISPQSEYTPPVIYSQESRGKLVFLIEIRFEPAVAAKLHPGQPVDVVLPARK